MKIILIAVLTGLVAGVLGALCGVGGGVVMVPAFVGLLGMQQKPAVATSLAVIIITALAATVNNVLADTANTAREKLVDWKLVLIVGAASALAAWYGTDLMRSLSNQTLTRIFGGLLLVMGVRMLWKGA